MKSYPDKYGKYYHAHKEICRQRSLRYYHLHRKQQMLKHKNWLEDNRENVLESQNSRNFERTLFLASLKSNPCVDCGSQYPYYVMDFDHVVGKKVKNIAAMRYSNETTLFDEISKCQLVCSNCHRERTQLRLGKPNELVKMS